MPIEERGEDSEQKKCRFKMFLFLHYPQYIKNSKHLEKQKEVQTLATDALQTLSAWMTDNLHKLNTALQPRQTDDSTPARGNMSGHV